MTTRMGLMLILIGTLIVILGIFLISREKNERQINFLRIKGEKFNPQKMQRTIAADSIIEDKEKMSTIAGTFKQEEALGSKPASNNWDEINKAKGDAFEDFVVKKFNTAYFILQEWRSDKYVDGVYANSNKHPDLQYIFNLEKKGIEDVFSVECKWRNSFNDNQIKWAEQYQINNYQAYSKKFDIPVFVIIGIGGAPGNPKELFVVPLHVLKSPTVSLEAIARFRKETEKGFFWNYNTKSLS